MVMGVDVNYQLCCVLLWYNNVCIYVVSDSVCVALHSALESRRF